MSAAFERLERDLTAAAGRLAGEVPGHERAAAGEERPRRAVAGVAVALSLAIAGAAAAAFQVLGVDPGAPSPAPREQRVAPGTSRVLSLRALDPDPRAAPWSLRLSRSRSGRVCVTAGQVLGGRFGIVGTDGRLRARPKTKADACGQETGDGPAVLGMRVFGAAQPADVRTIVNGVAGEGLARVTVAARGGPPRAAPHSADGAFLVALRGYPQDAQPVVSLRWRDGRVRRYPFAADPFVVPDPLDGPAWRVERAPILGTPLPPQVACVSFSAARPRPDAPRSPALCGRSGRPGDALFWAARRLGGDREPGREAPLAGDWNGHPPRTALWGSASPGRVRELVVTGPRLRRAVRPTPVGSFLVVLSPEVRPADLRVEVRFQDGRITRAGSEFGVLASAEARG
jgi:hypothetical protein